MQEISDFEMHLIESMQMHSCSHRQVHTHTAIDAHAQAFMRQRLDIHTRWKEHTHTHTMHSAQLRKAILPFQLLTVSRRPSSLTFQRIRHPDGVDRKNYNVSSQPHPHRQSRGGRQKRCHIHDACKIRLLIRRLQQQRKIKWHICMKIYSSHAVSVANNIAIKRPSYNIWFGNVKAALCLVNTV